MTAKWEQIPVKLDVVVVETDRFALSITESVPTYLATGSTVNADVYRPTDLATPELSLSTNISPSGTCAVTATAAQMTALGAGTYVWRLWSGVSGGRTVASGAFVVRARAHV